MSETSNASNNSIPNTGTPTPTINAGSHTTNTVYPTTKISNQSDLTSNQGIFASSSQSSDTGDIQIIGKNQMQVGCPACPACPAVACPALVCPDCPVQKCQDPYNVCPEKLFITQENPETIYIPQECPKQECPIQECPIQECPDQEDVSVWKISVFIMIGLLLLCCISVLILLLTRKKKKY